MATFLIFFSLITLIFFSVQVNNSILISDHCIVSGSLTIPADTSKKDIPVYSRCSFNAYHFSTFMVNFDNLYENVFRYSAQGFYEEWYIVIHSALHVSIKQKRDKRIDMPFYFSSHTVHISKKVNTEKRRHGTSSKLLALQI